MARSLRILAVLTLLGTACAGATASTGQPARDPGTTLGTTAPDRGTPLAATRALPRSACPVTLPSQPSFVPPEPYPSQAPALYRQVWYGTGALWTMLAREGEVWEGLPHYGGAFGQKTLWWSQGYSLTAEPTPSITVTGRRLDGPGSFEAGEPGTNGSREDIGSFMLVGVDIPTTGCWELTARYGGAELTYVVLVER